MSFLSPSDREFLNEWRDKFLDRLDVIVNDMGVDAARPVPYMPSGGQFVLRIGGRQESDAHDEDKFHNDGDAENEEENH